VKLPQVKQLAEKWFGDIPAGKKYVRQLPQEPAQTEARRREVTAEVPLDALYTCYPMYSRLDPRFYVSDVITDLLSGGSSSRLYQSLVKEKQLFSQIECYHLGSLDPGLVTIEGKLVRGVSMEEADRAIREQLSLLVTQPVETDELQKVKNRVESLIAFEDMSLLSRCNNLAFYELLGDAALINEEMHKYDQVTPEQVREISGELFNPDHANTLYYFAKH
jgi:predicted Zn-dependent peptidase